LTGVALLDATPSAPTNAKDPWLKLAQDAYTRSTTYFDNNYRKSWEDNLRMFQSKHPRDSKYMSDSYKFRSRIFRPKREVSSARTRRLRRSRSSRTPTW
jgi:hypothetical protein